MSEILTRNHDFNMENITPDSKSARIISPAYASPESEMNAICQYFYHHLQFKKQNYPEFSKLLEEIAEAEMRHLDILGTLLIKLGTDPILSAFPPIKNYFYSTGYVAYSNTPIKMLSDDIKAEKTAIAQYTMIINKLDNIDIKNIIEQIKADEEVHLAEFQKALSFFEKQQKPNM